MIEFISPGLRVMLVATGILFIMTIPVMIDLVRVIRRDIQDFREARRGSDKRWYENR